MKLILEKAFLNHCLGKLKFPNLLLILLFLSNVVQAQDTRSAVANANSKAVEKKQANPKPISPQQVEKNLESKFDCEEFKNFQKEQKNRAQKVQQIFQNLSPQQRKLIEAENLRHEAEINKIMGIKSKKIGQNDVKSR